MMNLVSLSAGHLNRRVMEIWEDWRSYSSGGLWTTTAGGSATAVVGNTANGVLVMSAIDSTLNREIYVASTNALFGLTANKPILIETLIQFTEANVNKANVAFGLMNSVGAASMQDTTGEPKTNFSGAVIYKVPGGSAWKTCSSLGTAQNVTQTSAPASPDTAYHRLGIELMPLNSTTLEVRYFVDGNQLKDNSSFQNKIKDIVTFTGGVNMQLFHCLKNGSTTPETLNVDYTAAEQLR